MRIRVRRPQMAGTDMLHHADMPSRQSHEQKNPIPLANLIHLVTTSISIRFHY